MFMYILDEYTASIFKVEDKLSRSLSFSTGLHIVAPYIITLFRGTAMRP
jgi:hypothetical protein